MKISARNVFPGTVTAIKAGSVNSEVSIEIAKGIVITAVITKSSAKHLGLKKGAKAYAVIKASNVLLATD
jgi:molybdopterin-binding protein